VGKDAIDEYIAALRALLRNDEPTQADRERVRERLLAALEAATSAEPTHDAEPVGTTPTLH
jgi:hypothetical protein